MFTAVDRNTDFMLWLQPVLLDKLLTFILPELVSSKSDLETIQKEILP